MTLRWYGSKFDTVTLQQIKQIPGVTGVITTLYDTQPGEVWSRERIHALAYTQKAVDELVPEEMFESIAGDTNGSIMPGWEPERMAHVKELFEEYKDVTADDLFDNLKYRPLRDRQSPARHRI